MDVKEIYNNTVKFTSQNEHTEAQILEMLMDAGYSKKTWGINTSGRGRYVEVKFNSIQAYQNIIKEGIHDSKHAETYLVEPAFEANKTQITVFNVPLGASGQAIQEYLESNNLKVLSHERQTVTYCDEIVKTGVIKYRCQKQEGFQNLPNNKTFYNNRRLGFRHPEQYEERNKMEVARQQQQQQQQPEQQQQQQQPEQQQQQQQQSEQQQQQQGKDIQNAGDQQGGYNFQDASWDTLSFWSGRPSQPFTFHQATPTIIGPNTDIRISPTEFRQAKEGYIQEGADEGMEDKFMDVQPTQAGKEAQQAEEEPRKEEEKEEGDEVIGENDTHNAQNPPPQQPQPHPDPTPPPTISNPPEVTTLTQETEQQIEREQEQQQTETTTEERHLDPVVEKSEDIYAKAFEGPKLKRMEEHHKELDNETAKAMEDLQNTKTTLTDIHTKTDTSEHQMDTLISRQEERINQEKGGHEKTKQKAEPTTSKAASKQKTKKVERVKETKLRSKPVRTAATTPPPPEDAEQQMLTDVPEEGEILTPTITSFKRNKQTAEFSTDEDIKLGRDTKKPKQPRETQTYILGDLEGTVNNKVYPQLKQYIETTRLTLKDKGDLMYYLLKEKGDITGLHLEHMKTSERDDFIAYTCFLTAGNIHRSINAKPSSIKAIWSEKVLSKWKSLGMTHKTKDNNIITTKYEQLLDIVNKRNLNV